MSVFLGIELGSTRIKAALINEIGKPLATGGFDWENRFEHGIWTYHLDCAWNGIRESVKELISDYNKKNKKPLEEITGIGISAMMHGYLVFDKNGSQLSKFRTWRNTITQESSKQLTSAFGFNIPQRWSIAHLHHAVTTREAHVDEIDQLTTLAGYIHYKLTGKKVVGIGEASGIFPIDSSKNTYNSIMMRKFDIIVSEYEVPWKLNYILPKILLAGEDAGSLTAEGAKLLDPTGLIKEGTPLCPPEGDAGTGMVATNAATPLTGNISAGTSVFAMLVLENKLEKPHSEIDMITTPVGKPVAMVHCNNCTADLDAWINLFSEMMLKMGIKPDKTELYRSLYNAALEADKDCGGLVSVNYLSGEHLTGFSEGRPLFIRTPNSKLTVENFMRSLLLSSMTTLKLGMNILTEEEGVRVSKMLGHGGLFKTPGVGQKLMAGALNIPITVMDSAGEGGAWGSAVLAAYASCKQEQSLENFLETKIFADTNVITENPDPQDVKGFDKYLEIYKKALEVEKTAVEVI